MKLYAFLLGIALATGCGTFSDAAHRTKGSLAVGLLTAVEAWQEVDLAKQRAILDESTHRNVWEGRITEYRAGEQAKVSAAFRAARHTLAVLSKALDAYDAGAGDKRDVAKALQAALQAAGEVVKLCAALGIKVPTGGLL